VRRYTYTYLEETGIQIHFGFPEEIPAIPMSSEIRRNLFLTIKEGLHNIVKHSGADKVTLALTINNKNTELTLKDNGHGFDPGSAMITGNGLSNMKKRIQSCGGTYNLSSSPGTGTTIFFSVTL
jgi:signal transduction histidine kinase